MRDSDGNVVKCPVCGSKKCYIHSSKDDDGNKWYVVKCDGCRHCSCECDTRQDAIEDFESGNG